MTSTSTRLARLTAVFCITSLLPVFPQPAQAAQRAGRRPQGDLNLTMAHGSPYPQLLKNLHAH